ncbi:MAG: hypothetical protein ACRETQ_11255 [Gammaproteobacteria bacterium]
MSFLSAKPRIAILSVLLLFVVTAVLRTSGQPHAPKCHRGSRGRGELILHT